MSRSAEEFVLRHALLTAQEVAHLKRKYQGVNFLAAAAQEGFLAQDLAEDCQHLCDAGLFDGIETLIPGLVLLELIGKGGSGRVFRAWQSNLRRVVAVKVIPLSSLETKERLGRAVREARIAARLSHPSLVRAYDVGQTAESLYIVLEYVEGETLSDRIRGGQRLSVKEALKIALGVTEGLAFAAANGIAHRDIKPANIQLTPKGGVKILDLGLARPEGESTLTAPLVVHGTPSYVAPEQARGEINLTPACDIYSLGLVLFRMLTGRHPYKADTPQDMLRAHISGTPPTLDSVLSDVPAGLSELVAKMLAKSPDDRPDAASVAGHLRLYLKRFGEYEGAELVDTTRQQREGLALPLNAGKFVGVSVILVAAVMAGLAIWFLSGNDQAAMEREQERLRLERELAQREAELQERSEEQRAYAHTLRGLSKASAMEARVPSEGNQSLEQAVGNALREQDAALTPPDEGAQGE